MELDSIKLQLRELQQCYDDDTKSDDDIIYLVYNWVKGAHVVAQLLLLEGRFPELRRCLDLCRNVLAEQNVGVSSSKLAGAGAGGGSRRKVISRASGEDLLLMDSLRVRTSQLQKQYEEARTKTKGRDTQYYMNKLLRPSDEEGARGGTAVAGERRPPTPPERGISFGRRTRLNRWKVPPVLPPLVTETRPFFRTRMTGGVDGPSDPPSRHRGHFSRATSSLTSSTVDAGHDDDEAPPQGVEMPAEKDWLADLTRGGEPVASTGVPSYPELGKLEVAARNPPAPKKAPRRCKTSVLGSHVRALSAGLSTAPLPSGELEYRFMRNVDAHVMKAAIAIKAASEVQQRSVAVMQAMTGPSSLFLQQPQLLKGEQQAQQEGPEQMSPIHDGSSMGNWKRGAEKKGERDALPGSWRLGTPSTSSFSVRSTRGRRMFSSKRQRRPISPILSPSKTLGHPDQRSHEMNVSGDTNVSQNLSAEAVEDGVRPPTRSTGKDLLKVTDFYPHLSLEAKEKLEGIYDTYKEKSSELRLSMRAMRRKVRDQIDIFKPHEQVVLLEDPAVWKARRRNHAAALDSSVTAGSSVSESYLLSVTDALDSKSFLNASGAVNSGCLPLPTANAAATALEEAAAPDKMAAPSSESVFKTAELEPTTSRPFELGSASRGQGEPAMATGEARGRDEALSPGFGELTYSGPSSINCTLPACIDVLPSLQELRLARLNSSTHVAFPMVHAMVTRRAAARVEQEKRLKQFGAAAPPPRLSVSSQGASREATEGVVGRQKRSSAALETPSLETKPKSLAVGQSGKVAVDTHAGQKSERGHAVAMPLSLEEIHRCSNWVMEDATLGMGLPFHLATVRLQCACRRFLARRERYRRAVAVEEYLSSTVLRGNSAIIIQRYVRRWLSRRQTSTMLLRLGYQMDQRVANEAMYSEDTGSDDAGNTVGLGPRGWRIAPCGAPVMAPHKNSLSFSPLGDESDSFDHHRRMQLSLSPAASCAYKLYLIPVSKRFEQSSARCARLRRIQEKIASRVILRAFRDHLHRAIKRWEMETRTYMNYATGRLAFGEAFGVDRSGLQPRVEVAGRTRSITEKTAALDLSQGMSFCSSVFPLPPERVSGDVVAAWEARTAEARRWGDFMTPLEQVKLSKLQEVRRKRQVAEAVQHAEQEKLQLQKEEELQQRQRVKLDAALLLQRCARGYRLRQWFAKQLQKVREEHLFLHRRAELLDGNAAGPANSHIANLASSFLLSFSVMGKSIPSEAQPVPPDVAAVIMKGIYRRNPMRFGINEEVRRKQLEAVVMVQCLLRARASLHCVVDRYIDLCAIVIQRRWRIVLKRRKALKKGKRKCIINVLRAVGA
ncbi:uncharacterized protein Tco025E_02222 [Trypanosoma conorhini]|uniref:Uncharacterized protein n=1 Tax=Trypanosoma conorhini TaxID=83891 RepID=A0A422Q609_9TRYP|nr:uncharacterized protein Tco025E_02222 [Trypanosoma conorhini]RNF25384.1 hypothetical protein Tco025E_02222 [Trypanosoma conorhini]